MGGLSANSETLSADFGGLSASLGGLLANSETLSADSGVYQPIFSLSANYFSDMMG
ncbi:hypothetical protein ACLIA0_05690 [Bacillaceae bacterium W0354]